MYLSTYHSITFSSIHSLMDTRLFLNLGYRQQCCREQGCGSFPTNVSAPSDKHLNVQLLYSGEFLCSEASTLFSEEVASNYVPPVAPNASSFSLFLTNICSFLSFWVIAIRPGFDLHFPDDERC